MTKRSTLQAGDSYPARTVLLQTDFGIKPISAGAGTIGVKTKCRFEFQIFPAKN